MKTKELVILCLIAAVAFLLAIKYGILRCPNVKGLGVDDFEAVTPNACVDMMELGFDDAAVNACVAYSNRCDAKYDVWHSPVVAAEVNNLYAKLGKDQARGPGFITAFGKDACANPIACSSDADCPKFLRCGALGGGGSACQ